MKKLFLAAVMALMTSSVFAQLITSNRAIRSEKSHNVWVDLGVGTYTTDGAEGADLNLGIRYNKMFTENIGWDIIKLGARANTDNFEKSILAEALTGIRGESPVLFGNSRIYGNVAGGYVYSFDSEDGAFAWEVGAGLKLSPRFNIGIAYNSWGDGVTTGVVGLKLGFAL